MTDQGKYQLLGNVRKKKNEAPRLPLGKKKKKSLREFKLGKTKTKKEGVVKIWQTDQVGGGDQRDV